MSNTAPKCGVCIDQDSKYKCPACELRYCSISCYKQHKEQHSGEERVVTSQQQQSRKDRPGTTQRVVKTDFSGFGEDEVLQRLFSRYPLLRTQLQMTYGLSLDPGPEDARSWNRQPLYGDPPPADGYRGARGSGRGRSRGGRGRGGRGGWHAGETQSDRGRGPWTQEKGDREALTVLRRMRQGGEEDERAEGLREFGELCRMRFGAGQEAI